MLKIRQYLHHNHTEIQKNMKKRLLLLTACFASTSVMAACPSNGKTIFHCTTNKNYVLQLCDQGKNIHYSFGKARQTPEMALAVARHKAKTWQWHGAGRTESYSVSVPNGNTTYRVFSSFDKIDMQSSSGVEVERNGKLLTTIYCNENKPMVDRLMGVDLPAE